MTNSVRLAVLISLLGVFPAMAEVQPAETERPSPYTEYFGNFDGLLHPPLDGDLRGVVDRYVAFARRMPALRQSRTEETALTRTRAQIYSAAAEQLTAGPDGRLQLPEDASNRLREIDGRVQQLRAERTGGTRIGPAQITTAQLQEAVAATNAACPNLPPLLLEGNRLTFEAEGARRGGVVFDYRPEEPSGSLQVTQIGFVNEGIEVSIAAERGMRASSFRGNIVFSSATGAFLSAHLLYQAPAAPWTIAGYAVYQETLWRTFSYSCHADGRGYSKEI